MADPHAPRWRRFMLLDDDKRFGLARGDILRATRHRFEGDCKLVVLHRESDGFDPECSVYRCQVARIRDDGTLRAQNCTCGCSSREHRQARIDAEHRQDNTDG